MVVIGCVDSQPELGAGLIAVPYFVKLFCLPINLGVQPRFLFVCELNLCFINGNVIWLNSELRLVVVSVCLVPMLNGGSGSAEPDRTDHDTRLTALL